MKTFDPDATIPMMGRAAEKAATPVFVRPVFYQPGKPGIIDEAHLDGDTLRSMCFAETLDEIRARYPAAEVGELDDVAALSIEAVRSPPAEITREQFDYMLCVLPPEDWQRFRSSQSFKMSERTYGALTSICATYRNAGEQPRYFEMTDFDDMPHEVILWTCQDSLRPVRNLTCSCCGTATRGRQWYNRDTGFGLCAPCISFVSRNQGRADIWRGYGVRGVHFDVKGAA